MSHYEVERPKGCIRSREELLDLIIEARKEKKAIRLWGVVQMGHIEELFLTSKSRIIKPEEKGFGCYDCVPCWKPSTYSREKWYKTDFLPVSYGIGKSGYSTVFALFTSKRRAVEYSERLKNDPAYVASVHAHWARCKEIFRDDDWD